MWTPSEKTFWIRACTSCKGCKVTLISLLSALVLHLLVVLCDLGINCIYKLCHWNHSRSPITFIYLDPAVVYQLCFYVASSRCHVLAVIFDPYSTVFWKIVIGIIHKVTLLSYILTKPSCISFIFTLHPLGTIYWLWSLIMTLPVVFNCALKYCYWNHPQSHIIIIIVITFIQALFLYWLSDGVSVYCIASS